MIARILILLLVFDVSGWFGWAHGSGRTVPQRGWKNRRVVMLVPALAVIGFLLAGVGVLNAASQVRHTRTLVATEQLVIKGEGCQPFIRSETTQQIRIKCVKPTRPQPARASAGKGKVPAVKTTIILVEHDKLNVLADGCNLSFKRGNARRLVLICTAPDTVHHIFA